MAARHSRSKRDSQTKGERTREQVVERAAALFNQLGYANASMSDIMQATGLQKGGIYRHFPSKQALSLEAFDFAVQRLGERFQRALEGQALAADRLRAIIGVYATLPSNPPVAGGCPILNAAIESDDADPTLKRRVRKVMQDWQAFLRHIISDGQRAGELRCDVDPEHFATLLVAALEGAIMMSKLLGTEQPMTQVARHLAQRIQEIQLE